MLFNNNRGLGSLTDFYYFVIISILFNILYLVKQIG